jgi:hypothetical protein
MRPWEGRKKILETRGKHAANYRQNLGASPQTPQGASPLTSFIFFYFHPKGENKKIKEVQGACSLPGFGAEPRGFARV